MPDFDTTFMLALVIVFFAAAMAGLAGFGFSIVSVPVLLLLYDPSTALALNKILTIGTTWIILVGNVHHISWRHLRRLIPFALVGLPGGIWVLKAVDADTIRLIVGITVLGFALLLLSGLIRHIPERPWMAPITGLVSGVSSTSTGMSGPPLVLFFTVIAIPVEVFRATSVTYFLLLDLVGFPALISQGIVSRNDVLLSLWLAPAALAGRWAGSWLVPFVSPIGFRRVVLGLLLLTGSIAIADVILAS
jgi:uncharacterized membrane protein YfcA